MRIIVFLFLTLTFQTLFSQNTWYVSPNGTSSGDGSITNPWDLQTVFNHPTSVVSGDLVLLRGGQYQGRFMSYLKGDSLHPIQVKSFPGEWAILNGNTVNVDPNKAVLSVFKGNVIYQDFEITWLGQFSRLSTESSFEECNGISHFSGKDCKFINLIIHDNPGSGIGSWKNTGATEIYGCLIFNNGYIGPNRGHGAGMYVQNKTNQKRWIENNIIFNNYYKGLHFISANNNASSEYVKNFMVLKNTLFGNYTPSGGQKDNIDIGTYDQNGINMVKNITLKENILYHNVDFSSIDTINDAQNLTIGLSKFAPVENVVLEKNIIIGKRRSLRLQFVKSIKAINNVIFTEYIYVNNDNIINHYIDSNWLFSNNNYYTRYNNAFKIKANTDYVLTLNNWQSQFNLDSNSIRKPRSQFSLPGTLEITKNKYQQDRFKVVLFDMSGNNVNVDFSKFPILTGTNYEIRDVENLDSILTSGQIGTSGIINFPMNLTKYNLPLNNTTAVKTLNNFGVFFIDFDIQNIGQNEDYLNFEIEKYPNPVQNVLYFNCPDKYNVSELVITNQLGISRVFQIEDGKVDLTSLSEGIYILSCNIGQTYYRDRIIIAR